MKRPLVPRSSPFPNASVKVARRRMEHVAQYSQNNVMPMPHHPALYSIDGASSPEAAVKAFWDNQRAELQNLTGFNIQHSFSLCRVKRVLKAQPEVRMVSGDAPALFSKACEYFVLELTLRAWVRTQACTRQTIQGCDFVEALKKSETYGFLVNRVHFGPCCAIHQGVLEHAEPEHVLPRAEMMLPDMNVPFDMNQIEQENVIAEPFNNKKGFDFDLNTIYSEHDSDGSY
ncbi:unnamed protein product [Microthlaspi erraticum]|uniref:Transcription factor CBF/NF-Y/archaeal histone domain-containing protein n=1 Tax=Microthlaspi erraticum TaxID=1685480 RepID=A0A6D2KQN7_9BRAS|nr:unnamed protein product [Microthlaspi erraticum]